MKITRYLLALVLVCAMVVALPFTVQAKDAPLTLDKVTQISDTEIVLEFSEPIEINKYQSNRGPYCCIRWCDNTGNASYAINKYNVNGEAMQWEGQLSYIGDDHSKLLWTISMTRLDCSTIDQVLNPTNEDMLRSIEKNKLKLRFVLEEVPFNQTELTADGKIDNVTTADGSKYLFPNFPKGWERYVMDIEANYNYPIDRSNIVGVKSLGQKWDFDVIFKGEGITAEETPEENVQIVKTLKNDPAKIAMIFGADVLLIAVAVVVILVVKKKRKAA